MTTVTGVTYPELRALMAKHGLNYSNMAELTGTSINSFGNKINGKHDFSIKDMVTIKRFFAEKGESVTVDFIFFD